MPETGPYPHGPRGAISHSQSGMNWRKYVYSMDCFDRGLSRQNFGGDYDIVALSGGGGSNEVTSVISHNTLITGAILGNTEGTRVRDLMAQRAREVYAEIAVELPSDLAEEFRFGFYKDANEYVYIEFDKSVNANWRLTIDDGGGPEFAAEVVAMAAGTHYMLGLWVEADGTPHWAVGTNWLNMTEIGTTGIANKMTADGHYIEYYIRAEDAFAKTAYIDYLEIIKSKHE